MARQLAALTRNTANTAYRYSPTQVKDSSYFGINHTLQTTSLSVNGQLNTPEFKTPPEGRTPVDQKHFDYEEETLKTLQATHNFSLSFYERKLNDSGITQQECLDSVDNDEIMTNEVDVIKINDDCDAYHTPPESRDENTESPPFGYPPSSDKLINSVINLLSKTEADSSVDVHKDDCLKESDSIQNELCKGYGRQEGKALEEDLHRASAKNVSSLETKITVNIEQDCFVEKDSLDGSPNSRRSFTQEEDDSGISIVDENDILHESNMSNNGHFEAKKEFQVENKNEDAIGEMKCSESNSIQRTNSEKTTYNSENEIKYQSKSSECEVKYVKPNGLELKCTKSNYYESEDASVGWQTRQKRMSKKRHDRMSYYNDTNSTESHNRSSHKESTPRRSTSKNKDRNLGKTDKTDSYSKVTERNVEERYKEKNGWNNRRSEDSDVHENSKRTGRRGGQAGKKSDNKYTKNGGNKEKYSDFEKHESQAAQNAKQQLQPSVFSYRDALLKAESKVPKEQIQSQVPSKGDKTFNLDSAVNYLSTVWTSVNNLHRKDPSKVYIYNAD